MECSKLSYLGELTLVILLVLRDNQAYFPKNLGSFLTMTFQCSGCAVTKQPFASPYAIKTI